MPSALAALHRLGVDPPGVPLRGIRYLSPGHAAQACFPGAEGRGVRRTTLSAALLARAEQCGVTHVRERVGGIGITADGTVRAGPRAARYLVAADGLHSPVRRELGLARVAGHRPRFGLRRHYRVAPWTDLVEVHWARDAEAYVTPVDRDLVGVAILCGPGLPYDAWLGRFPALAERLAGAPAAGPVLGAGPLRQSAVRRVRGPVLLAGDAAGYVDALTGEGLAVGLAGAERLVECIARDQPGDYEREWRRVTRRPRLLTTSLLAATGRPALRNGLVPAAQRLPVVFRTAVRLLA